MFLAYAAVELPFAAWLIWQFPSMTGPIIAGLVLLTAIVAEGWEVALRRGAGSSGQKQK